MENTSEAKDKFNKKAEEYLKYVIRNIIVKNFKEQEDLKCAGYLPVYKKLSSGRCFNDIAPEDIRGDVTSAVNNSIAIFIRNKYSIKDCNTYAIELLDLHHNIKITITKIENLAEIILQKKGFDKIKDGCYFINQDDLNKKLGDKNGK